MTSFYKNVNVTIPYTYMKYVVGKNGNNLKKCKKKYDVNSVWYNTKRNIVELYGNEASINEASSHIENLIEKVKKYKIPKETLNNFTLPEVIEDKYVEGNLSGALNKDEAKHLIGKNGINFKKITKECEVSFIWYNEDKHSICIWGPESKLENTVMQLHNLIKKIKNNMNHKSENEIVDMETD